MDEQERSAGAASGLFSGYAGRLLGLLAVGQVLGMGTQLIVAPLLPAITADLGITPVRAGIALSLMWGLTAVGQYPAGRFADATTRKTVLVGGLLAFLAGALVLAGATTYPLFLLGAGLLGVGGGFYPPTVYVQLADLFTARRGRSFGVVSAAQDLGGALAPLFASAALLFGAWRSAFLPIAAGLAVLLVLLHRWHREGYVVERAPLQLRAALSRLYATNRVRWLMIATALFATVWQGTVSFLPTLLQVDLGFSPGLANAAFSSLFVVGIVGRLLAGTLSDRLGHERVAIGTVGLSLLGLLLLVAAPTIPLTAAGVLVFGFGLAAYWPVIQSFFIELFPGSTAGRDFGAMRSTYILFGSLGPTYVGVVAEQASYRVAFGGFAVVTLASIAILTWLGLTAEGT